MALYPLARCEFIALWNWPYFPFARRVPVAVARTGEPASDQSCAGFVGPWIGRIVPDSAFYRGPVGLERRFPINFYVVALVRDNQLFLFLWPSQKAVLVDCDCRGAGNYGSYL